MCRTNKISDSSSVLPDTATNTVSDERQVLSAYTSEAPVVIPAPSFERSENLIQKKERLLPIIAEAIAIRDFPNSEEDARERTETLMVSDGILDLTIQNLISYLDSHRTELLDRARLSEEGILLAIGETLDQFVVPMSVQIFYQESIPKVVLLIHRIEVLRPTARSVNYETKVLGEGSHKQVFFAVDYDTSDLYAHSIIFSAQRGQEKSTSAQESFRLSVRREYDTHRRFQGKSGIVSPPFGLRFDRNVFSRGITAFQLQVVYLDGSLRKNIADAEPFTLSQKQSVSLILVRHSI